MREALEVGERALAIARREGLRERTAYVLTDLFQVYFQLNRPDRGRAALQEARATWRELGVLNMLADNLATTAMLQVAFGDYAQALESSREALQLSQTIGNLWDQSYAHFIVDLAHFDRGDIGPAIKTAEECMRLARQAGFAEGINQTLFDLVLIYTYVGALPRALEAARPAQADGEGFKASAGFSPPAEALPLYVQLHAGNVAEAQAVWETAPFPKSPDELRHQFFLTRCFLVQIQAELELAQGHDQHALVLIEDLIAYYAETGVRLFFPDVLALQGRLLRAAGRLPEARAALEAARAAAESMGSRRSLWQILSELAELAAGRGEEGNALALRRQAAEIIQYIAEHAGAAELRESFLNRPDVRLVLSQAGRTDSV